MCRTIDVNTFMVKLVSHFRSWKSWNYSNGWTFLINLFKPMSPTWSKKFHFNPKKVISFQKTHQLMWKCITIINFIPMSSIWSKHVHFNTQNKCTYHVISKDAHHDVISVETYYDRIIINIINFVCYYQRTPNPQMLQNIRMFKMSNFQVLY